MNPFKTIFGTGIILAIFTSCINDPEPDKTYSLSIPLAVGKTWAYESVWQLNDSTVDSSLVWTTISAQEIDSFGMVTYEFKDSTRDSIWYDYYQKQDDGIYLYASTPGGIHVLFKQATIKPGSNVLLLPILWAPFEFKLTGGYGNYSEYWNGDIVETFTRFIGMQRIITRAGSFDCYKFEKTGTMREKWYHYFCSGFGLVMKEEINDSFPVSRINPATSLVEIQYHKSIKRNSCVWTN